MWLQAIGGDAALCSMGFSYLAEGGHNNYSGPGRAASAQCCMPPWLANSMPVHLQCVPAAMWRLCGPGASKAFRLMPCTKIFSHPQFERVSYPVWPR